MHDPLYLNISMYTDNVILKYHASATPVALASSPSTSAVQTGLYHVQVTIWSDPQYLVDDVQLLADIGRRLLRSANYRASVVPRTQSNFGDRASSVAGPKIWNNLPPELRVRHQLWTIQKHAEIVFL